MSTVIDNRVVEMAFDNSRFEKNVQTSISTLDKLKAALNFDGAVKGINQIESAFQKLGLGNVSAAVDKISDRFSAMGIVGMQVLQNLTNKAIGLVEKLADFAVFDNLTAGWQKYEDKTTAVQTIMAATQDTWQDSAAALGFMGDQMEFVNSQMDKLNWFTDETSYNFVDMVSNIGKFTSNQIPLEQAVTAMQGIANWAAVSGQNAASASRAMYNLAQAIGVGSVKLMDWRSIENANMATAEFKQKVLDVAVAQGQLTKSADGIYKTMKGTEVSIKNFSQTLSEGWFSSDVLISTLDQYGAVTDALYRFSEASGLTATEILQLVEANKEGTLSMEQLQKISDETGMSMEDLQNGIGVLSSEAAEFGIKVFKAAQEAKTFTDAVDALKDAASTKWMNIYENIFGDYEKARKIWTGFANFLYDEFVAPLEKLEEVSKMLGHYNAVERLASDFVKVLNFLRGDGEEMLGILGNIRQGFETVFPALNNDQIQNGIKNILNSIDEFADGLEVSVKQAFDLQNLGHTIANALQTVANSARNLWNATEPLRTSLGGFLTNVRELVSYVLTWATHMDTAGLSGETLSRVCQTISDLIESLNQRFDTLGERVHIFNDLKRAAEGIMNILQYIGNTFANLWHDAQPLVQALLNLGVAIGELVIHVFGLASDMDTAGAKSEAFATICQSLAEFINKIAEAVRQVDLNSLKEKFSGFTSVLETVDSFLKKVIDGFKNFASTIKDVVGKAVDWVKEKFAALKQNLDFGQLFKEGLGVGVLTLIGTKIVGAVKSIFDAMGTLKDLKKKVSDILDGISDVINSFTNKIKFDNLKTIATAILMLAGALLILGFVDYDNAIIGIGIIGTTLAALLMNLEAIGKMDVGSLPKMAGVLLALAAALLLVAIALGVLAGVVALFALVTKMDTAWKGLALMLATLTGVLAALIVATKLLSSQAPQLLAVAASLLIVAAAMLVFAAALAAFALIAKMDTAWEGIGLMLVTLAGVLAGLVIAVEVLGAKTPLLLAAAGALLIAAAAMLVLAGAVAAFALITQMEGAWEGLGLLAVSLAALTVALIALGAAGPMVLVGAAALLVGAAALIALSVAVGVAAVALMILGPALTSFGEGIKNFVSDIGEAISNFFTSIAEMLPTLGEGIKSLIVSISEGIGESISALGSGIGEAVAALGSGLGEAVASIGTGVGDAIAGVAQGIADAIAALIASIGEGIGKGLSAVSSGLSDISKGISDFGDSVRGLAGISWTATAVGIGELALALKKLNKKDLSGNLDGLSTAFQNMLITMTNSMEATTSKMETGGQTLIQKMVDGMNSKNGEVQTSVTALMTTGTQAIEATYSNWQNDGTQLIIVVIAGMESQRGALTSEAGSISDSGSSAVMATSGTWEYAGQMLGQGLANGLWSMLGEVQAAASALASAAAEGVEATAQINSPSKVATWEGEQYGEGMVIGIKKKIGDVKSTSSLMVTSLNKSLANAQSRISSILSSDFTPVITPVLDLSNVNSFAGSISDLDTTVGIAKAGVIARRQSDGGIQNGSSMKSGDTITNATTIHIHQQPGQNAEELADAVERRLAFKQKQRQVAYVR